MEETLSDPTTNENQAPDKAIDQQVSPQAQVQSPTSSSQLSREAANRRTSGPFDVANLVAPEEKSESPVPKKKKKIEEEEPTAQLELPQIYGIKSQPLNIDDDPYEVMHSSFSGVKSLYYNAKPFTPRSLCPSAPVEDIAIEILTEMTILVEFRCSPYPDMFLEVGQQFSSLTDVEKLISRWERDHKMQYKINGNKWKMRRPGTGKGSFKYYEREYACIHGGDPPEGHEEVPRCPARFTVKRVEGPVEKEDIWMVTSTELHHWNHKESRISRVPGVDYSKISIRIATPDMYHTYEEYLEEVVKRTRKRFLYDRYTDSFVPKEKLTRKVLLDPRNPRIMFPKWNPYYNSAHAPNGHVVLPPHFMPPGFYDSNPILTKEQKECITYEQLKRLEQACSILNPIQSQVYKHHLCNFLDLTGLHRTMTFLAHSAHEHHQLALERAALRNFQAQNQQLLAMVPRNDENAPSLTNGRPRQIVQPQQQYVPHLPSSPEPIGDIRPNMEGIHRPVPLIPLNRISQQMQNQNHHNNNGYNREHPPDPITVCEPDLPEDLQQVEPFDYSPSY